MADPFQKVRPGQSLRIPAAAYNAFVDAAADHRRRERDNGAAAANEPLARGLVLVRNDSEDPVEPYHALAITGVLVEPGEDDQERTFQGRMPLTGDLAGEDSPPLSFVIPQQPIEPGQIGRCVISGVTPALVLVRDETDTTCELAAGETTLASTPLGGAPILWKEEGTGPKWAVVEVGRPSLGRITAILGQGEAIPTESNRWRYPWAEAWLDGEPGSETYLRYIRLAEGLSSKGAGGGEDPVRMAINRFEAHHMDGHIPAEGFAGLLGVGPVCELPGVLPKCPPARSLQPRLVPIPPGVCVQLTCERDTKGGTVWVFEAMSLVELADPSDGDRKFNLYIPEDV